MKTKTVAQLDENGVFIGKVVLDETDINPLKPNEWLIPGGCILTLPDEDISPGIAAVWLGDEYSYIPLNELDSANKAFSDKAVIAAINFRENKEEYARGVRDELLRKTDWTQLNDVPKKIRDLYKPYRKQLRDITKQKGWPIKIVWPIHPENHNQGDL